MKLFLHPTPRPVSSEIVFHRGGLEKIGAIFDVKAFPQIVILTDENVAPHWLSRLKKGLNCSLVSELILPAGESEKNAETLQQIWKFFHKNKLDRSCLLINLGGGVITDMGGFAALTFMRGMKFWNVPTTLLAQTDASIGGKTGIDFDGAKNLIGSFSQPEKVLIDAETLKTLPEREFVSGFAEILKYGLITDRDLFDFASSKKPLDFTSIEMEEIVSRCVQIKISLVEDDETEQGRRKLLNFGHTIGHAIESLSLETDHPLLHGEAIALGMIAEAKISKTDFSKIRDAIVFLGFPTKCEKFPVSEILKKISSDKKKAGMQVRWTLLEKIGKGIYDQVVSEKDLIDALQEIS